MKDLEIVYQKQSTITAGLVVRLENWAAPWYNLIFKLLIIIFYYGTLYYKINNLIGVKSTNLTSWRNSLMAKLSPFPDPQLRASAEPILVRDQEEVPRSWFVGHSTNPQSWRKTFEPIDGSYEKVFPASKKRKFVEEQNFSRGGNFWLKSFLSHFCGTAKEAATTFKWSERFE